MRIVMLCFALLAAGAFAQDAPEKAVREIRDVQIGMSRDHVLAGLADQYQCSRLFGSEDGGFEAWSASPKHGPESSGERESAIVTFRKGKAVTVDIKLYPSMTTAEAVRFAGRLFRLLYQKADSPMSPNDFEKAFNARYVTLPVELRDFHNEKAENLSIIFTLGGQEFSISVTKEQGQPDRVDVVQSIVGRTSQK